MRSPTRVVLTLVLIAALAPRTGQAQLDTTWLRGMTPRSIGPTGMSGRIGAIDGVHADPNVFYVGAATGGLWKTTSGGVQWTPVMDGLPAASIGAIAIYQRAPDIVWVGTGEAARRNSAGVGTGVYRTLDGGRTWTALGLERSGAISGIVVHPDNPDVAWVAALGNTWAESDERGVFKTTDGGRTWRKVLFVNGLTGAAGMVVDPSNPSKLLVAMWEHRRWPWFFNSGGPGSALYLTVDAGETWRKLGPADGLPPGPLGKIGLDFSRSNPRVVYAKIEATRSVLSRSDDGGFTWREVNRTEGVGDRPFYYGLVRVDPDNENRVYNIRSPLDLSEDGGKTFRTLLPFERVHVDHHAFYINPRDGRFIVDGNDGGVYISRDRGATWRFVENLPLAQFYHINVDMATPFNVMGGLQDNGTFIGPSSVWENGGIRYHHWREIDFGDGFAAVPDPTDTRYAYAMSQGGNLVRSDLTTGEWKDIQPHRGDGPPLRFNWNAAIAIDPFDGAVYYGSQFVHRTTDRGRQWTVISPDLTTNDSTKQRQFESGGLTLDVTAAENHTTIVTIGPSPVERGVIWVGTDDGNVQLTRDGGRTWTNLTDRIAGAPRGGWVPHIEPSKFQAGTAFVVYDDHRRGNNTPYLFRTTDFGRTWTSLVTPDIDGFAFLHVIEQDPVVPELLFLGSEFGMYVSIDGGTRWTLWRQGLPRVPHQALIVHPRDHDLVIGTHGRAAYILDDVRPLRALARSRGAPAAPLTVFEIPPAIQYQAAQVAGMRFLADGKFVGPNRPYGALISYFVKEGNDSAKVALTVRGPDGAVVRRFEGPARTGINRTAWDLRHDGPRRPAGDGTPSAFLPPGPLALPGAYTVTISRGTDSVSAPVTFSADPRFAISDADLRAKHDLLLRMSRRQTVATEAGDRIAAAEKAVSRMKEQLGPTGDAAVRALADSAGRAVLELKELFLGPQGKQGIVRSDDAIGSQVGSAYQSLGSSRDAPTAGQLAQVRAADAALQQGLDRLNGVMSGVLARLRAAAARVLPGVFPAAEPLVIDWVPPR